MSIVIIIIIKTYYYQNIQLYMKLTCCKMNKHPLEYFFLRCNYELQENSNIRPPSKTYKTYKNLYLKMGTFIFPKKTIFTYLLQHIFNFLIKSSWLWRKITS